MPKIQFFAEAGLNGFDEFPYSDGRKIIVEFQYNIAGYH
jgi:hypothetical protein